MLRLVSLLLVGWLVAVAAPALAQDSSADAHQLETRLIAPCCWRETLDIHQSPIADQLRREIRQRLTAGESVAAVEAALVVRYGPKLRATLPGSLGYLLFGLFGIGGLAILIGLAVRMTRRAPAATPSAPAATANKPLPIADRERQKYEDQLDDDLADGAH